MTQILKLPDRLDSSGAPALVDLLMAHRGAALTVDASGVGVIGALAMEVLIAAGRQWQADDQTLAITQPSGRYSAACESMGLSPLAPWQTVSGNGGMAA